MDVLQGNGGEHHAHLLSKSVVRECTVSEFCKSRVGQYQWAVDVFFLSSGFRLNGTNWHKPKNILIIYSYSIYIWGPCKPPTLEIVPIEPLIQPTAESELVRVDRKPWITYRVSQSEGHSLHIPTESPLCLSCLY